ncbi:hypothetical protein RBB50_007148 [Rhinocladiella similis]
MCLFKFFPCISHDAEALHRILFQENNAGVALQVFRCKWYHCANLNVNGGLKLCPYLTIRHQIEKLQIEEQSHAYKAVLENDFIDHGCGKCWDTVCEEDWVQTVHTQMVNNDRNMMPAAWAETLGDSEDEEVCATQIPVGNDEECGLVVTEDKGKRKRGCSEISIPPPHWASKSKKACMSAITPPSGLLETDSDQQEEQDEEFTIDSDQEEMDFMRACHESMQQFEREQKGKGKVKQPALLSAMDGDEVADPDLEWALQASIEDQEATQQKRRPTVDQYMNFGSGGESSKSVIARQQPVTPPSSEKSNGNGHNTQPAKGYKYDIVALLKEKVDWQQEKAALVSENARVLQTNVAHVERERELVRRIRDLEELCFPTEDDPAVAEVVEIGE